MTRASVNDLSLNRPSLVRLNFMNDLTACSAPLLFQGTPSESRKVNSFEPTFLSRFW